MASRSEAARWHPSSGRRHRSLGRHTRSAYPTDKLGTILCCAPTWPLYLFGAGDGLYSKEGWHRKASYLIFEAVQ